MANDRGKRDVPARTPGSLLLRDLPADLETEADAFGHEDYAKALAALLRDVQAPFTVGLFGPWGQGKSTVLERLRHHVPKDVVVTTFDAWRHEGHALRRHFLKALGEDLMEAGRLPSDYMRRRLRLLDADAATARPTVAFSLGRLVRALLPAAAVAACVLAVVALAKQEAFQETLRTTPWAVLGSVIALGGFLITFMSQLLADAQETTTLKRLDEPDRFTDEFESMLAAVEARRVLVVVDNLDRCSPGRALETLSTVKTYLEPAVREAHAQKSPWPWKKDRAPTDAVFLVAVDDAALRRHLLAKEMTDSALTSGKGADSRDEPSPDFGRRQADAYVTEYLRKFFGLTVTVHDLLDDDMRAYTRERLAPVLAYWSNSPALSDEDAGRAADLITFALGRNPRRIKQFINSFSARLQLIVERETGTSDRPARLHPAISHHVHTVLLLALMAERWPEQYSLLKEGPRELNKWFSWAEWQSNLNSVVERMHDAGDNPNEEDFRVLERDDWPKFSEFLRRSDRPNNDVNLRPFFTLKQTELEVRLPEIEQLQAAMLGARWQEADDIVEKAESAGADYVRQLGRVVEDERGQGYAASAAAYVRALLKMPRTLGAHPGEASRVIGAGYRAGGRLADEAFANGPDVLACMSWMREEDVRSVMALILTRVKYAGSEVRRPWLQAIDREFDALPQVARDMLKELAADEWPQMYRIDILLKARPELLPDFATDEVLERLDKQVAARPQPPPASDFSQRQQWVEDVVGELGRLQLCIAGHHPDVQTADYIARTVASLLPGTTTDQDHLQALLKKAFDAVGKHFQATTEGARSLSDALDEAWNSADAERKRLIVALAERAVVSACPTDESLGAHWRGRSQQARA